MNKPRYLQLSRESQRYGDEFYRCVADWLRALQEGQRAPAVACDEVAEKYKQALEEQLFYLEALKPDPQRDEALRRCQSYLNYLDSQLDLLHRGRDH